ncbi:MAG: F0F1 ATP synthase subunit gamma [Clostridium argentinense]|nr:F0F1 ATP synthase subunit gamma [Clostridium argentinense]
MQLLISIYSALVESSVSEQGARRMAMESATNNAEEMIAELELGYNRVRQTSITREITEIAGGVEALK